MDEELLAKIKKDFPVFVFKKGKRFAFRPPKTIIIGPNEPNWDLMLLHELGHALLEHRDYGVDIKRLKMEMEAWEKARELAQMYEVKYNEDVVQAELDTYRDWLHQKSRCPICGLTRFETPDGQYHCPRCENF